MSRLFKEGGNVFKGQTASIARENIPPTLDRYFADLKRTFPTKAGIFNLQHFHPLGSVGKKPVSGDIDLGVSASDILDQQMSDESIAQWNIDPAAVTAESEKMAKRARSASPEQIRMKAFLKLLCQYINQNSAEIHCDEAKVSAGNIFGLFPQFDPEGNNLDTGVQIDWMVGNLDWLKFSYYSSEYPPESNVKGLHRTQLLLSAFQVADLSFNHVSGVKDKATGETIATNPNQALEILNQRLGTSINSSDVENYYSLFEKLQHELSPQQLNQLIDIYFKILDSTRADIPDNLQKKWVEKKDQLGLSGKFLPDNSALKQFVSESGVAGAPRIPSRDAFKQFMKSYQELISQFPGFKGMKPSGSYNSDPNKNDFGDIDLVVYVDSAEDKKTVKKQLETFFKAQPETIIVPFDGKYAGRRTYNSGEIVSVRYQDFTLDSSAQIDNMIALSQDEATFKQDFLDMPAAKQGLVLGLVKTALLETDPAEVFNALGIKAPVDLPENQEYEFNLSSTELQLRKVTYEPGTYKQASREIVWTSRNIEDVIKLLSKFDLSASFEDLLQQAKAKLRNPRSGNRIKGVFNSMVSVKSGEVGTAKAAGKEQASNLINQTFTESKDLYRILELAGLQQ